MTVLQALELLSHISKRISGSQKTIELPVCEIIKACSKDAPQFRKRIALTYLKVCILYGDKEIDVYFYASS